MEDIIYLSSDIVNDDSVIATHLITKPTDCALHSHTFYECFYIIQGNIEHAINGNTEWLSSGDFFLLPPGLTHQFLRAQERVCIRRDVMIPVKQLKRTAEFLLGENTERLCKQGIVKCRLSVEQVKQLEELLNRFSSIKEDEALKIAYNNVVCVKIAQTILDQTAKTYTELPLWILQLLQKFSLPDSYVKPLQKLLEPYNYNRSYLSRTFKKHIGVSISEYFLSQKLHYACLLLHTTSSSVSEIAERSGFHNLSFFNRCFKAHFAITPREYRKQIVSPQNT